jgi:hypothetical protein
MRWLACHSLKGTYCEETAKMGLSIVIWYLVIMCVSKGRCDNIIITSMSGGRHDCMMCVL